MGDAEFTAEYRRRKAALAINVGLVAKLPSKLLATVAEMLRSQCLCARKESNPQPTELAQHFQTGPHQASEAVTPPRYSLRIVRKSSPLFSLVCAPRCAPRCGQKLQESNAPLHVSWGVRSK